ncbi:pimeloyl-CoA dehydrogenase small subunit [soil metagenome]|jgi:alkylation response protein AidB-like acyl-CoA dehydrogenase|uniref:acyl-CoA dehydrogenase family protein n=1 Tax=Sphingobium sp. CECT 9361 TaxID=2845384 RepID=UPI001E3CFFC2|nr:acyl-CoA dehydrogenase [Sphingobium sp. CECT 9361]CAH0354673.1 L-prolyl-[peptidyl-carrier protein] dehydrogenase [Sphingobium sp. CECT 9361]|tara:strand:- start:1859 stop:2965 length:1107 start_codon:yes stop_codon:yes gene_type:complete
MAVLNFDLSEEQSMLRDLIVRFATDRYDSVKRLAYVREPFGFSAQGWSLLAETGALGFPFGEESGGFGGGAVELITVMEALGRSVAVEPVLPVIVLAGGVIERAGTQEQKAALLPGLTSGERFAALACAEHNSRFNVDAIVTNAVVDGANYRLNGTKQMVVGGPFADDLIVAAKDDSGAIGLYLVASDAEGVSRRNYRLADGSVASDVRLTHVLAAPMAGGRSALDAALADARLAICGELVGLMAMMFDSTLDYLKTRNQFGQAIGDFQAIQHRMADNYGLLELSRGQMYRAAAQSDEGRDQAVTGAKAFISTSAITLAEDAVQLHGGIGTTEELMIGQAFKRVLVLASLFGDNDWELRRYVALTAAA